MPIYDYKCQHCGQAATVTCPIKNHVSTHTCKNCGHLTKQIFTSPPSIQLRGEGWSDGAASWQTGNNSKISRNRQKGKPQ